MPNVPVQPNCRQRIEQLAQLAARVELPRQILGHDANAAFAPRLHQFPQAQKVARDYESALRVLTWASIEIASLPGSFGFRKMARRSGLSVANLLSSFPSHRRVITDADDFASVRR